MMECVLSEVPHLDLRINENDPDAGILTLLQKLRPTWSPERITLKSFTEGITNRLIGCFLSPDQDRDWDQEQDQEQDQDVVLVRIFGRNTDLFVDRSREVQTVRILESKGCGPKIYCSFNNGISYEYLQGAPLSQDQLEQPRIYRLVAAQLAKLHSVQIKNSESEKTFLWKKMEHFLSLIQKSQSEESRSIHSQSEESRSIHSQSESRSRSRFWSGPVPGPEVLKREMNLLKSSLSRVQSPVVLCHNDLLTKNIIYNKQRETVKFIDFEYADFNYQAFDIGNHFNEFAGVSDLDYGRYPSPELQHDWIRTYLQNYNQETGSDVTQQEVTRLYVQVCKFSLASNLFWGMWAVLQAQFSSIDFDFSSYAAARLDFYFQKRDEYLQLDQDQDQNQDQDQDQDQGQGQDQDQDQDTLLS
ncbi:hypothetical protein WMY93_031588 [Mugilogobius chulae]|uniref:ethanolamine kinase n=1 Tax=Mugilogobius chulae TaxID=88201 RepID=A0AAW0MFV6_9GOBI